VEEGKRGKDDKRGVEISGGRSCRGVGNDVAAVERENQRKLESSSPLDACTVEKLPTVAREGMRKLRTHPSNPLPLHLFGVNLNSFLSAPLLTTTSSSTPSLRPTSAATARSES
jgi:hypothetical protein